MQAIKNIAYVLTQDWATCICIIVGIIIMLEGSLAHRIYPTGPIPDIVSWAGLGIFMLPFICGIFM